MWPTIKAIKELGGSASISEIVDKIIEIEKIPESIQNIPHKTGPLGRVEYNMAWARSYLKKAGAINNSERGVWSLTELGARIKSEDIKGLVAKVREMSATERRNKAPENESFNPETETEVDWKSKLLTVLQTKLTPAQFERLTQRLLRESGFSEVEVTGRSGDSGIDGQGLLKMGLLSFKVIFQCKRYQGSVGPGEIRDFRGAMQGRAEKGLFVTTGSFTRSAREEGRRDGAPPVDLIDGDELCQLLKQLKLGVSVEIEEIAEVNQKWFENI